MEWKIIKSPSQGTVDILMRRMGSPVNKEAPRYDAIGLVQGQLILLKKRLGWLLKIFEALVRRILF